MNGTGARSDDAAPVLLALVIEVGAFIEIALDGSSSNERPRKIRGKGRTAAYNCDRQSEIIRQTSIFSNLHHCVAATGMGCQHLDRRTAKYAEVNGLPSCQVTPGVSLKV